MVLAEKKNLISLPATYTSQRAMTRQFKEGRLFEEVVARTENRVGVNDWFFLKAVA